MQPYFSIVAFFGIVTLCGVSFAFGQNQEEASDDFAYPKIGDRLTDEQVTRFANLALKGIHQEYPNKPNDVLADASAVKSPRALHPAFYGCFDWHSSVHGHWMLVRLLKLYPDCSINEQVRNALAKNLTKENLIAEAAYFEEKLHKAFERTYGWAWYLKLVAELDSWDDPQGKQWRQFCRPLEKLLVKRTLDYLPKSTYPVRTGIHPDTGFGLAFILDYARTIGDKDLASLIEKRARDFYLNDVDYPTRYEPSGQDFFSSCLNEADLMRRVLKPAAFASWLDKFLPALAKGDGGNLLSPVEVSDVTDGYIVHLAGLDLSRAWCMQGIASALPKDDPRRKLLVESSAAHARTGFSYVFSGHYEGEHWLATFAVYVLSDAGMESD